MTTDIPVNDKHVWPFPVYYQEEYEKVEGV